MEPAATTADQRNPDLHLRLRLHAVLRGSRANGPGLRRVLWLQGCSLSCPGCFNPGTHSGEAGRSAPVREVLADLRRDGRIEGVTLSGGEPMEQPKALLALLRGIRSTTALSTILFSGHSIAEIRAMPLGPEILEQVDVLIDGRYVAALRTARGLRGSANQRIHLLTGRYSLEDIEVTPSREIVIERSGDVVVTGVGPHGRPEGCEGREARRGRQGREARPQARILAAVLLWMLAGATPSAEPVGTEPPDDPLGAALDALRAVGREGRGNPEAKAAWPAVAGAEAEDLSRILAAMDGASPIAANWLRAAFESIAERRIGRGASLPADDLEEFILDLRHAPRARRLAYEWLSLVDGTAPDRLIPRLADDPGVEFRRDAVARIVARAEELEAAGQGSPEGPTEAPGDGSEGKVAPAAAAATYREALRIARDVDQVRAIAAKLGKLGETVDIRRHFGFLQEWKLIGPFDHSGSKAFDVPYPPEIEIAPEAEYDGKGQKVRWTDFRTQDEYGVVDLNRALGRHKGAIAYALAEFVCSADGGPGRVTDPGSDPVAGRAVEFRLGSVNAWKLWLNGEPLFGHEEYHHGMEIDQFRVTGRLRSGQNRILLKICQNEQTEDFAQEWRFQLRITDATGTPIPPEGAEPPATAQPQGAAAPLPGSAASDAAARDTSTQSSRSSTQSSRASTDASRAITDASRSITPVRRSDARDEGSDAAVRGPDSGTPGSAWLQFRGPGGRSTSGEADLPTDWGDAENLAWKVDLPGRGVSSPIVTGSRVIVTASGGHRQDRLHVLCFDAGTGRRLWERRFWSTGRTSCHPKTCMAAPTPASDGDRAYAFYSTGDLACLDLDGNLVWYRGLSSDYPNATSGLGMASSPILCGGVLVVQVENQSDSFAAGIDPDTGENVWRIRRSSKPSWSTPVAFPRRDGSGDVLILESWDRLSAHDPRTGRELWAHEAQTNCIPSCVVFEDLLLLPSQGVTALREPSPVPATGRSSEAGATQDSAGGAPEVNGGAPEANDGASTPADVVWQSGRIRPATASPIVVDGKLYVLANPGILTCADARSGEVAWQFRLKGPFSSTPLAASGHLYCINEEGFVQIVRLGSGDEPGEVAATHELGQTVLASPAAAGGAIYIRSDAFLWRITRGEATSP